MRSLIYFLLLVLGMMGWIAFVPDRVTSVIVAAALVITVVMYILEDVLLEKGEED